MSLRFKTLLLLGLTVTLSLIALYLIADLLVLQGIAGFESETARADTTRVREALANDMDDFGVILRDWSVWDATYEFAQTGDPAYIESNLPKQELASLNLNAFVILDDDGKIVYSTGFDLNTEQFTSIPGGLEKYLAPDSSILPPHEPHIGFIKLPAGVMLIGSHPIVDSLESKPARGTLVFGRYFGATQVAHLAKRTHLTLTLYPWDEPNLPAEIQTGRSLVTTNSPNPTLTLDGQTLLAFTGVEGLTNQPVFLAVITEARTVNQLAQPALQYFLVSLALVGAIGIGLILLLAERLVLRPVAQLSNQVRAIGEHPDTDSRVTIAGQAELGTLGENINTMLAALEDSRKALDNERARYRAIVEGQREWIIRFLPGGTLTFANEAFCGAFDKPASELIGTNWFDLMPEATRHAAEQCLQGLTLATPVRSLEMRVPNLDGTLTWQSWTWHAILNRDGQIYELQGVGDDITERVEAEEQSRYLSSHDALTGLYNRAYFESELERVEQDSIYPLSIVVGDVDHLKPINDNYGHSIGDATLRLAASILSTSFRTEDIVARIGGDEFAIVMPGADAQAALAAIQRVQQRFFAHNILVNTPSVDMSLGVATATKTEPLSETLKRADQKMYESKFARHAVALSGERTSIRVGSNGSEAISDGPFPDFRTIDASPFPTPEFESSLFPPEERYRMLMELLPIVTYVAVPGEIDRTPFLSPQVQQFFGYSSEEWLQDPHLWSRQIHPDDHARVLYEISRALDEGTLFRAEYRMFTRDGRLIWVQDHARILQDPQADAMCLYGFVVDITKQKQAADRLLHRYSQMEAMSSLPLHLNRSESLNDICAAALATVIASPGADRAAILLMDETGTLHYSSGHAIPDDLRRALRTQPLWGQDTPEPEPILARRLETDPAFAPYRHVYAEHGIRAAGFIPLRSHNKLLGALCLFYDTPNEFAPEQVHLAQVIANQTGLAIARLNDENARRGAEKWSSALSTLARQLSAAESSRQAAEFIAEAADRVLHWDAFFLAMYSQERELMMSAVFAVDLVEGMRTNVTTPDEIKATPLMHQTVAENGILILRPDTGSDASFTHRFGDKARPSASLMFVPIRHGAEVIAILSIQSYSYNAYDHSGLEFLRTLAEHCGGALGRIRAQDGLQAKTAELARAYDQTIEGWSEALDLRDHEIRGHAHRVVALTLRLAERLGVPPDLLPHLRRGALLHDIGKMALPDEILFKPGPLSEDEWKKMRRHPVLAYEMLKNIEYLNPALDIPYCHHEHWNGTGYPRGLRGEDIPLAARIFAVVDVWDALLSNRSYRDAWETPAIRNYLEGQSGKQFDPHIVRVFLEMMKRETPE